MIPGSVTGGAGGPMAPCVPSGPQVRIGGVALRVTAGFLAAGAGSAPSVNLGRHQSKSENVQVFEALPHGGYTGRCVATGVDQVAERVLRGQQSVDEFGSDFEADLGHRGSPKVILTSSGITFGEAR